MLLADSVRTGDVRAMSPEELARSMRQKAHAEATTAAENEQRAAIAIDACMMAARIEIEALRSEPMGGLSLMLQEQKGSDGRLRGVTVDIGRLPTWVCRPMVTCSISGWYREGCGSALPIVQLEHPCSEGNVFACALRDALNQQSRSGTDVLRVVVAMCMNEQTTYSLPAWYWVVGEILAWPLAITVFLVLAVGGGLWGVLLGWIPATLAYYAARSLWCPVLILAIWAAQRG